MKNEIIFYDYEFNRLGRSTKIISVYHKELYNGIGTFEAELSLEDPIAEKIADRDYTVAVWGDAQAIITSSQYGDSEGAIHIYGRTPNWILSRRACPSFKRRHGTPYAITAELVDEVWGDCIETGTGTDISAEEIYFWRNVYNPLNEVVEDCLDRCGGGHRVVFDRTKKEWRFEMYTGKEKSYLFSQDRRNIFNMTVKRSVLDHFNGGFYTTNDDAEIWKEIPSDREGLYKWTARLTSSGESSAKSELEKKKIQDAADFTVTEAEGLFSVGDIVTAQRRRGGIRKSSRMRVAAVESWAERGKIGQRPILEEI